MMTIEHAKETGFSSIIPELKQDEPGKELNSPYLSHRIIDSMAYELIFEMYG